MQKKRPHRKGAAQIGGNAIERFVAGVEPPATYMIMVLNSKISSANLK